MLDRVDAPTTLGAWASPEINDPTADRMLSARSDLIADTRSDLPIANFFYPWSADPLAGDLEAQVLAAGGIPMVSWNDRDNARVVSGAEDGRVRRIARGFAALDGPVLLRWGWEMDAESSDGGSGSTGGAELYVQTWTHLRDIFREEGADNVEWVWCPNAYAFTPQADRDPTAFYPGDDQVDWLCADGYNWYPSRGSWRSFSEIFSDFYAWAEQRDTPILIGEFGVLEDPSRPDRKADWILAMARTVVCEMPEIRGLVYFNELRTDDEGITRDWRLTTSSTSLRAWQTVADERHFGGDGNAAKC